MKHSSSDFQSGILCGLGAALIWGAWPVVSGLGVADSLSPYDVAALRFGVAGLVLLPMSLHSGLFKGVSWWRALLLACGAGVPYVVLTVEGLRYAPAGHAGIIVPSCMLTFTTCGAWLLFGNRPSGQRVLGLLTIVSGLVLVGWSALATSGPGAWRGNLLFVGSGFLWASYTLGVRAWALRPLQATAVFSVLSLLLYLPPYMLFAGPSLLDAPLVPVVTQAVFQGLLAAILALLLYTRAVALLGAARGALFAALVPGTAVLLAFPLLGERPTALELAGLMLVSLGMVAALGVLQARKARPNGSRARAPAPVR